MAFELVEIAGSTEKKKKKENAKCISSTFGIFLFSAGKMRLGIFKFVILVYHKTSTSMKRKGEKRRNAGRKDQVCGYGPAAVRHGWCSGGG